MYTTEVERKYKKAGVFLKAQKYEDALVLLELPQVVRHQVVERTLVQVPVRVVEPALQVTGHIGDRLPAPQSRFVIVQKDRLAAQLLDPELEGQSSS